MWTLTNASCTVSALYALIRAITCWEVVILTRRLLLELISAVFSQSRAACVGALLFSMNAVVAQWHQPWISDALNRIEPRFTARMPRPYGTGLLAYVGTPAEAVFVFLFLVGNVARIVPQQKNLREATSKPQEKVEIEAHSKWLACSH